MTRSTSGAMVLLRAASICLIFSSFPAPAAGPFGTRISRVTLDFEYSGFTRTAASDDIVGVVSGDLAEPIRAASVYIFGLRPNDQRLCLRIRSIDGSYDAQMRADVASVSSPADGAKIDLKHLNPKLKRLDVILAKRAGQIAISAQVISKAGACDTGGDRLIASWQPAQPAVVTVSFLGGGSSAWLYQGANMQNRCGDIDQLAPVGAAKTVFDQACQIEVPACGKQADYVIKQRTRNVQGPALPLRLRSPC